MRFLFAILVVLNVVVAVAQDAKESVPPTAPTGREDEDRVIYELEVSPADEPRLAMKYRLLPNPADLQPGNAATQYYKAFVLEATSPTRRKEFTVLQEKFVGVPLREIDVKELGATLAQLDERAFYDSIRTATFRSWCDWEDPVREQGVHVLLPALQAERSVGILLAIKAKYQIAQGEHDTALETARDAFTLAYHLQQNGEVLVQGLVGVSIIGILHDDFLLEWLQMPNSPSLYWALADVPPYFDTRRVITGDLRLIEYTLPALEDIERRSFTISEANDLAARAFAVYDGPRDGALSEGDIERRVDLAAWALQVHDDGYRELSGSGYSTELLDQMPVLQVALLARWKRYQEARDNIYKWATIVHGPNRELALRKQNEISRAADDSTAPFGAFLPALGVMHRAQLRQHRFLSGLRAMEALRLYAAKHGRFPNSLAEVSEVPVPNDPTTNAPFVYRGGGRNATLTMVRHRLGSHMEYEYRLRLREAESGK